MYATFLNPEKHDDVPTTIGPFDSLQLSELNGIIIIRDEDSRLLGARLRDTTWIVYGITSFSKKPHRYTDVIFHDASDFMAG